jgi:hypothetical protein
METVEHFAQVSYLTEMLGKQVLLSGRDVEKLLVARARYGTTTASTVIPGCPVTSDDAGDGGGRPPFFGNVPPDAGRAVRSGTGGLY